MNSEIRFVVFGYQVWFGRLVGADESVPLGVALLAHLDDRVHRAVQQRPHHRVWSLSGTVPSPISDAYPQSSSEK